VTYIIQPTNEGQCIEICMCAVKKDNRLDVMSANEFSFKDYLTMDS